MFASCSDDVLAAGTFVQWGEYREPNTKQLVKVAFRADPNAVVLQGNHGVSGVAHPKGHIRALIREFQYRSFEHLKRKVRNGKAAYDATDLPETEGAHWRTLGVLSDDELRAEWERMSTRPDLVYDPAPIR